MSKQESRNFAYAAWAFVVYLMGVIVFGAWVRMSGSGAGCGDHWPTCHGEVIPPDPSLTTIIEYTHRLTSGMCGVIVLGLLVWAGLRYGWKHRIVRGVVITTVLIVFEALIGAGIVLKALVENDTSVARAIIISLHLANTLALMGAASVTAWWASGGGVVRWSSLGKVKWAMVACLSLLVLTCMTGAVTALGDTLFPIQPTLGTDLFAKVRDELSTANHFLVRLRILHPVIAIGTAIATFALGERVRSARLSEGTTRWATAMMVVVGLQVLMGFVNIGMAAPGWAQLSHLSLAQILWICTLLMMFHALSRDSQSKD